MSGWSDEARHSIDVDSTSPSDVRTGTVGSDSNHAGDAPEEQCDPSRRETECSKTAATTWRVFAARRATRAAFSRRLHRGRQGGDDEPRSDRPWCGDGLPRADWRRGLLRIPGRDGEVNCFENPMHACELQPIGGVAPGTCWRKACRRPAPPMAPLPMRSAASQATVPRKIRGSVLWSNRVSQRARRMETSVRCWR